MVKRYANMAFLYAIAAMAFGVFYREFTKFSGFSGRTSLAFLHTHYFMLGMFFFLALMLAEKAVAMFAVKSKTVNASGIELTAEIRMRDAGTAFVNRLSAVDGVSCATLVSYNGEYMS